MTGMPDYPPNTEIDNWINSEYDVIRRTKDLLNNYKHGLAFFGNSNPEIDLMIENMNILQEYIEEIKGFGWEQQNLK